MQSYLRRLLVKLFNYKLDLRFVGITLFLPFHLSIAHADIWGITNDLKNKTVQCERVGTKTPLTIEKNTKAVGDLLCELVPGKPCSYVYYPHPAIPTGPILVLKPDDSVFFGTNAGCELYIKTAPEAVPSGYRLAKETKAESQPLSSFSNVRCDALLDVVHKIQFQSSSYASFKSMEVFKKVVIEIFHPNENQGQSMAQKLLAYSPSEFSKENPEEKQARLALIDEIKSVSHCVD